MKNRCKLLLMLSAVSLMVIGCSSSAHSNSGSFDNSQTAQTSVVSSNSDFSSPIDDSTYYDHNLPVSLNYRVIELEPNQTFKLEAKFSVSIVYDKTLIWSSSDSEVASVSNSGEITTKKVGDAVISVESATGDRAECVVYVRNPHIKNISLNTTSIYLRVGEEQTISATVNTLGTVDYNLSWESTDPNIATIDNNGKAIAVSEGSTTLKAKAGNNVAACKVVVASKDSYQAADGVFSFENASGDDKNKIIGALEKWAVENKLTGLTLYGDGSYVMYNERVQKGSNDFIPGYGFGILGEGNITGDLNSETNLNWNRYYHTYLDTDPETLNAMNYRGAIELPFTSSTSQYFDTALNNQKNGYDWVNSLADSPNNRPIPVDLDEKTGKATKYKIPVKVGSDLKYATLSNIDAIKAFNGREVKLDDYITPYKICFTRAYNMVRSREQISGGGAYAIVGAKDYYDYSTQRFSEHYWNLKVGIKGYTEDGKSYLEFSFYNAITPFEAMYHLSSRLFAPVPEDFIEVLGNGDMAEGVAKWGNFSSDGTLTPLDTFLSTGPYVVERWDNGSMIVLKKNELFNSGDRYSIPGIHIKIVPEARNNPEKIFLRFLNGEFDACTVPTSQVKNYLSDNRLSQTASSSAYRLNINACSQERWEQLFGINGSIYQTPISSYWEVEPAMSNKNFLSGLSYALNRKSLAESLGRTPTGNYIGNTWMINQEGGVAYNSTPEHADAVTSLRDGTDEYGYSLEKAKQYFIAASNELIDQGAYQVGDTIEIEIAWQNQDQVKAEFAAIKKDFEKAFHTNENPLKLKCKSWVSDVWSDVYYKKMMVGQYDIGFGNISGGSTISPLSYFESLTSNNSSGFTLNWGPDTGSVDGSLVYDNKVWSFDGLLFATNGATYLNHGLHDTMLGVYKCEGLIQDDGSLLVYLYAKETYIDDENYAIVYAVCIYATTDGEQFSDYSEYLIFTYEVDPFWELVDEEGNPLPEGASPIPNPLFRWNETEKRYEITFSSDLMADWLEVYPSAEIYMQGIDVYYMVNLLGDKNVEYVVTGWTGYFDDYEP